MIDDRYYEIEFKARRRDTFHCPITLSLVEGEWVMVEADRGEDVGRVVRQLPLRWVDKHPDEVQAILRKAFDGEVNQVMEKAISEREAMVVCKLKVKQRSLPMKILDAEYQFDLHKLTFYFTADNRIDFRELVRDLASVYKTRIELRQIGPRDEMKRLGGVGQCGRALCCSTFLRGFKPIPSHIVKGQYMGDLPSHLTGVCGRLKCCVRYEPDGEGEDYTFTEGGCGEECTCGRVATRREEVFVV
ncbi:MAG: stage 0 sporulation family protein [Candidatus Latescibacteria bacterium]|nr:stage 0 sporulation family protein [Candidatus Latescibacterota bacterium]